MKWGIRCGAAAALVACTTEPQGDIYWSAPGASEEQLAQLEKSCVQWNTVARRQQHIAPAGTRGTHLVLFIPREQIPYDPKPGAFFDPTSQTMYVSTGLVEHRPLALLHEQGHALGLEHIDGVGVMNKHGGEAVLTRADLAECKRVGACD